MMMMMIVDNDDDDNNGKLIICISHLFACSKLRNYLINLYTKFKNYFHFNFIFPYIFFKSLDVSGESGINQVTGVSHTQ